MPGFRFLVFRLIKSGNLSDVLPYRLESEGFGLFGDAITTVGAVHLNQPHDDLRMPMKTVTVIDVQGVVEIMLGIFGKCGIGFFQHLVEVEAACGKPHHGIGIGPHIISSSGIEWLLFLCPHQRLAGFSAKHRIHSLVKASHDRFGG